MWFLIKGTFWFSLVLVLLPFIDTDSSARLETAPGVEISDTVSAASEAIHYVSALCLEKPEVCARGAETFVALGHRAREGARIAYRFLDEQFAEEGVAVAGKAPDQPLPELAAAGDADTVVTGTIAIPTRRPDRKE